MRERDDGSEKIQSITIFPGRDKDGRPERYDRIVLRPREIYAVIGNTGSGKSRFISDIEQVANGDTVTGRSVVVESTGERKGGGSIAFLGQSMRFVLDCSVEEFIEMHARCTGKISDGSGAENLVSRVVDCANMIASEQIRGSDALGRLSGGQSRALMIAGISLISAGSVVLIDEIENAGIDKMKALDLLLTSDKLVLIVTHDPHTALIADQRIFIRNGAVEKVIKTDAKEKECFAEMDWMYKKIWDRQRKLREGERLW